MSSQALENSGKVDGYGRSYAKKEPGPPDETRTFDQGQSQVVSLGDFTVTRNTLEPGWRWSEHVKPIAQTDSCQVPHTGYVVSGRLKVAMDDGSEEEFGPGDAYVIPPGHDGWIEGEETLRGFRKVSLLVWSYVYVHRKI